MSHMFDKGLFYHLVSAVAPECMRQRCSDAAEAGEVLEPALVCAQAAQLAAMYAMRLHDVAQDQCERQLQAVAQANANRMHPQE